MGHGGHSLRAPLNNTDVFGSASSRTIIKAYGVIEEGLSFVGAAGSARRLRLKVRVPGTDPRVPTVSHIWIAGNWAEREAYDLCGIVFRGHPNLVRILMPDDWEGFPLRKDYPLGGEPVRFSGEA